MPTAEVAHSIDLNLAQKLRDREYRQKFFLAESSADIAAQLIELRKRRDLNQQQVAELVGTKQPAISRIEKADYQSWSFSVLRKIAGALDARIRVLIEPAEDVLKEYDAEADIDESALDNEEEAQFTDYTMDCNLTAIPAGQGWTRTNSWNAPFSPMDIWFDSFTTTQPDANLGLSAKAVQLSTRYNSLGGQNPKDHIAKLQAHVRWLQAQLDAKQASGFPAVPTNNQLPSGI